MAAIPVNYIDYFGGWQFFKQLLKHKYRSMLGNYAVEFAPYFRIGSCLKVSQNIMLPCHSSHLPSGYSYPISLSSLI